MYEPGRSLVTDIIKIRCDIEQVIALWPSNNVSDRLYRAITELRQAERFLEILERRPPWAP